ncbi:hypothetical protein NPIL_631261 [Nephila pilipes]|uniref:Uncharacterized protein n=1 Tax=Nephila pilipes TaxID=299642 RepID=A0A8X6UJW0_NEPPI|nr:hypothetical protein NPIL_631261 [Nephila pilipes]
MGEKTEPSFEEGHNHLSETRQGEGLRIQSILMTVAGWQNKLPVLLCLKLSKQRYQSDEEVKAATQEWLSGIGRDFFAEGIEKLVLRLNKCLDSEDNSVGK